MRNSQRAVTNGKIVTIHKGKRLVTEYQSGDKLIGKLEEHDGPLYLGQVRKKKNNGSI